MPTTYTPLLGLPKHDPADYFNIQLINEGFDLTDAAMKKAFQGKAAQNMLDNSYFPAAYVINMAGKTSYTGVGITIDRWKAYHAATTHTVTDSGIAVSATDSNANLYQSLDPSMIDSEKIYTAVACDNAGNVYVWSGKPTTTVVSPVCVYYNGSAPLFRIVGAKTWRWAALYEGSYNANTRPDYVYKGKAAELLECLKHAIVLGGVYRYRATQITSSIIDFSINLPVQMRVRPTFDASALTLYGLSNGVMTAQTGFTFAIVQEGYNGIVIRATKANHGLTDALLGIAADTMFNANL